MTTHLVYPQKPGLLQVNNHNETEDDSQHVVHIVGSSGIDGGVTVARGDPHEHQLRKDILHSWSEEDKEALMSWLIRTRSEPEQVSATSNCTEHTESCISSTDDREDG